MCFDLTFSGQLFWEMFTFLIVLCALKLANSKNQSGMENILTERGLKQFYG